MTNTFKKCDLHVHSCSCFSRSFQEDEFIECIAGGDLEVLAITDHNSVDVPLLEKIYDKTRDQNLFILSGVELNVKLKDSTIEKHNLVIGKGSKGKYFHGIVWCSYEDRVALRDAVDELFLAEGCINQSDIDAVAEGKSTRKALSARTDDHAIYLEQLQEELSTLPHFFVFHENKRSRNLSDYLPNFDTDGKPIQSNIEYKDKLFYYSQAMAVEGGETSRSHISVSMRDELNKTLAALFFSDAKKLKQIGKRFTWIDFDGDLESLVLAISDPESRIFTSDICKDNPQTNRGYFLESVKFETIDSSGTTHVQTVSLSPGMNGVVGSRGSGKSMFAHIVAGKNLDAYSSLVNSDSIRYKAANSSRYTKNVPKYLYLEQGELEELYGSGSYSSIPFFKERLTAIEGAAAIELGRASTAINELIEKEKVALRAYLEKYPAGLLTMDVFDANPPSGLVVSFPSYRPSNDESTISGLKGKLDNALEAALDLKEVFKDLQLKSDHPETSYLFDALNKRVSIINELVTLTAKEIDDFDSLVAEVEIDWFFSRKNLEKCYAETMSAFNDRQDSSHLSSYNRDKDELAHFFEDLLKLRLELATTDLLISSEQSKMHVPIEPVKENVDKDEIVIDVAYSGFEDFNSAIASLTNGKHRTQELVITSACLVASEPENVRSLFNGTRVRKISSAKPINYLEKFLEVLVKDLTSDATIEETVSLNGIKLEEMSPGMRAEALLKLFLNDKIANRDIMFVILDQPEDNLDTETISKFLIPRLKSLKTQIQIIVISHSAPIVINGDARSLILCSSEDQAITYSIGAINDKGLKEDISEVLDGGERFLKMRLNKYNFQMGV